MFQHFGRVCNDCKFILKSFLSNLTFFGQIRALESPVGSQALGAGLFGRAPNTRSPRVSFDASEPERPFSVTGLPSTTRDPDPRANMRRASTMGPGVTPSNSLSSQLGPVSSKKRISTINGGGTMHARLYKILGDLFLLSGRTMDASIWYAYHVGARHSKVDEKLGITKLYMG